MSMEIKEARRLLFSASLSLTSLFAWPIPAAPSGAASWAEVGRAVMSVSAVVTRVSREVMSPLVARSDCLTARRSEEHTSELQSLMRISYAVFCLKKKRKRIMNMKTQTVKNLHESRRHKTCNTKKY